MTCHHACSSNSFGITLQSDESHQGKQIEFSYCRETEIFIDPTSEEDIEVGTLAYPFKTLIYPTRELSKSGLGVETRVTFYLRAQTEIKVRSLEEPLMFIKTLNVTIRPYEIVDGNFRTEMDEEPLRSSISFNYTKALLTSESLHNPIRDYIPAYDFSVLLEREIMTKEELKVVESDFKFLLNQASVHFANIDILEPQPTDTFYNTLFNLLTSFGEVVSF
eukprot:CAMPEP_0170566544 /NCGR_PEP_ID=MMETSP0211-20121228/79909_1 /TAXON_ID=311385 /ORGANISM="Pseudokeronopsis sp., Strain OXSARD2" /LENGTH=219 /DNA_ID=CAMNT_0010887755 /DNA_START=153 /DNA_END=812 /DNA_ORIENTATION=-